MSMAGTSDAQALLKKSIAANPRDIGAYCELAEAFEAGGEPGKAEATLLRAIEVAPLAVQPWRRLGRLYSRRQNLRGAVDAFERACALDPHDVDSRVGYGWALMANQDLDAARAACQSVLRAAPGQPDAELMAGHIHNILGHAAEAAQAYRRSLQAEPRRTDALYHLVDLEPPAPGSELALCLRSRSEEAGQPPRDVANVNFALARIHEAAGDVEEAMARYGVANAAAAEVMKSLGVDYDPARAEEDTARKMAMFPAETFRHALEPLEIDLKLVFVVGMPRSGTTLVERILGSHPQVTAGGELTALQDGLARLPGLRHAANRHGALDLADETDRRLLLELREDYVDRLFERDLDGDYVTDKLPANFSALGLVRLLFPDAQIVHCVRHPVAVCWSLYTAHFGVHVPYNASFEHLAHYHENVYRKWMGHWDGILRGDIVEAVYERLVADPDGETRRLVAACGLPWDDACLSSHRNEDAIFTANLRHGRRPVFTESVDRWRKFSAYLEPLTSRLTTLEDGA
jgi:tetratricopeptide (TPR) repeat protein